jgi:hypothetical protein
MFPSVILVWNTKDVFGYEFDIHATDNPINPESRGTWPVRGSGANFSSTISSKSFRRSWKFSLRK